VSKSRIHFDEGHSNLFSFCENVSVPGKSPVKVQPEILDIFRYRGTEELLQASFSMFTMPYERKIGD
jgi:hypothetical protein